MTSLYALVELVCMGSMLSDRDKADVLRMLADKIEAGKLRDADEAPEFERDEA